MYNKVNGKRSLLTVPVHGSMAAKIFSENKVLEGFTFVNSARNLLCMHWYSSLIRPCLSRSIDRVFSMNKGDIWRVCAFQDSKLWATAAWTIRTRSAWSRLTQCLSPNVRQTCLGISIRAAASWNLKVWTELRSSPMIDCSSLHHSLQPCASNKNERMIDSAWAWRDCLMRMCFSTICLDMTWLYRRLRVGRLSSSEKKQMSSRSLAT